MARIDDTFWSDLGEKNRDHKREGRRKAKEKSFLRCSMNWGRRPFFPSCHMWRKKILCWSPFLSKIPNNSLKLACFVIRFLLIITLSLLLFLDCLIIWSTWGVEGKMSVTKDGMFHTLEYILVVEWSPRAPSGTYFVPNNLSWKFDFYNIIRYYIFWEPLRS